MQTPRAIHEQVDHPEDALRVSLEKIVPQLMGDAEALEPFALDMGCIRDCESVTDPNEHSRNALRVGRLWLDEDLAL